MHKVATLDPDQRTRLFAETSTRRGLAPAVVEKDFWVCWVLKQIFSIEELRDHLLFKGGTSLSKIFHAINRFSEDIDLAIDWEMLGYREERSPRQHMSKTKRTKLLAQMLEDCQLYIKDEFVGTLEAQIAARLGPSSDWALTIDENDPHSVHFRYPTTTQSISYLKPAVVLELGTHAEFIPRDDYVIRPFAAEVFPASFEDPECAVSAIKAERTFWEKATILHQEHHRSKNRPLPPGYSRHYYDVAMMAKTPIKDEAIADHDLLDRVVDHKEKFYPRGWARYDLAVPGTLCLLPADVWQVELRRDYEQLREAMLFDEGPSWDELLAGLAVLENEINGTQTRSPESSPRSPP